MIENQDLVNRFNTLWEKAVKSATELTTAQEMGRNVMEGSVKKWQKEINTE